MNVRWIFIMALFFYGYVQGQGLVPYRLGNQWGYSDANGELKITPKYDSITPFEYNKFLKKWYAKTIQNGEENLIDEKGKILAPLVSRKAKKVTVQEYFIAIEKPNRTYELYNIVANKYYSESVTKYQFLESVGLFVVRKNKKRGLLDEFFNELAPIEYDKIRIKKINVYSKKLKEEDMERLKKLDVRYSKEYDSYFINKKQIQYDDPLILITLINQEDTKDLLYVIPDDSSTRKVEERPIVSRIAKPDKERTENPKFSNFDFQDCYPRNKQCIYTTKIKGQLKYGVYSFEMDKSSQLYDKIRKDHGRTNYIVSEKGKEGRMIGSFELSVPIEYEEVSSFAYGISILRLKKINNHGNDSSKYRYDYYDVKNKKVLVEEAQFFPEMSRYYEIYKPKYYRFFLVLKDNVYFYMGQDGRTFYKK